MAIVWQEPGYVEPEHHRRFVRLAVFQDGTILFNANQDRWTDELRLGQTSEAEVARIMEAIRATGVSDLKRKGFLPPDATITILRLRMDNAAFNLEWDHRDYNDVENYAEFRQAWMEVTRILASALPARSQPVQETLREIPRNWQ